MGTATTALQNTINEAFCRFAREIVSRTIANAKQCTYNYHAHNYRIDVVKDAGFPNDVPIKIFFQGGLEVASGKLNLMDQCNVKITPHTGDHLSSLAAILHGMIDRGEFTGPYVFTQDKPRLMDGMFDGIFKDSLTKFNQMIVSPARYAHPSGKYQWPIGEFTLEVDFPEAAEETLVPFTIFITESGSVARGTFNTSSWEVTDLVCAQSVHAIGIFDALSRMVEVSGPVSQAWEAVQLPEPPMILTNLADINDEWIEWFRKDNPGTSYAKAVHSALAQIDLEMKNYKKIIDKYAIPRY